MIIEQIVKKVEKSLNDRVKIIKKNRRNLIENHQQFVVRRSHSRSRRYVVRCSRIIVKKTSSEKNQKINETFQMRDRRFLRRSHR